MMGYLWGFCCYGGFICAMGDIGGMSRDCV